MDFYVDNIRYNMALKFAPLSVLMYEHEKENFFTFFFILQQIKKRKKKFKNGKVFLDMQFLS